MGIVMFELWSVWNVRRHAGGSEVSYVFRMKQCGIRKSCFRARDFKEGYFTGPRSAKREQLTLT